MSALGCAPGANRSAGTGDEAGVVAGFGRGVWHGAILTVTFAVSLFDDSVGVYETRNIGPWYDLGFLLGAAMAFGGGSRAIQLRGGGDDS